MMLPETAPARNGLQTASAMLNAGWSMLLAVLSFLLADLSNSTFGACVFPPDLHLRRRVPIPIFVPRMHEGHGKVFCYTPGHLAIPIEHLVTNFVTIFQVVI